MGDALIEAYGSSLEEAFENAAIAMFEVMTDTSKVEPSIEEVVEVEGFDLESLLYNWLESLLIKFDVDNRLFSKFKIENIEQTVEGYRLKARIYGEDYDSTKHEQKVGVKAVTYHMMNIERKNGIWVLRFLLDL